MSSFQLEESDLTPILSVKKQSPSKSDEICPSACCRMHGGVKSLATCCHQKCALFDTMSVNIGGLPLKA